MISITHIVSDSRYSFGVKKTMYSCADVQKGSVIAGTDFSPESNSVIEYAAALAIAESKPLCLAYAMPVVPDNSPDLLEIQQEELGGQIKIAEKLLGGSGLAVRGIFTAGDAAHELTRTARKVDAIYIVVGTGGYHGLERFLSGSVAEALVRRSNCPVIVVGPEAARQSLHTIPWKRLVFASDTKHGVTEAAQLAGNLAASHHASLTIITVTPDRIKSPDKEQVDAFEEMMSCDAWLKVKPQFAIRSGELDEEILRMVDEREADLLVMSARSGGRWLTHLQSGVVARILRSCRCPVMILRKAHKVHHESRTAASSQTPNCA